VWAVPGTVAMSAGARERCHACSPLRRCPLPPPLALRRPPAQVGAVAAVPPPAHARQRCVAGAVAMPPCATALSLFDAAMPPPATRVKD